MASASASASASGPVVLHTVIGDLVGSRALPDRAAAQAALGAALAEVNAHFDPAQPFEPTVGDEFQGACRSLSDTLRASLVVRLRLLPVVDSRCGVGHGEVTVHDASRRPLLQDGPGWWAAREALEALGGLPRRRTWYVGPQAGPVAAFLTCRDQLVDRLNDRGARMLGMALLGASQREIADAEGVWPSAVSQQFARGVGAVVEAHAQLAREER